MFIHILYSCLMTPALLTADDHSWSKHRASKPWMSAAPKTRNNYIASYLDTTHVVFFLHLTF